MNLHYVYYVSFFIQKTSLNLDKNIFCIVI